MAHVIRLASLLPLALLSACGGTATQPTPETVGDVSLHVTGGFTGWDRTVVVAADGTITYSAAHGPSPAAPGTRKLDGGTLARLHQLVSDPAFANLEAEYTPPPGGADLQRYAVTAKVGDRTLSTATWDGASTPQILHDVIAVLAGILPSTVT